MRAATIIVAILGVSYGWFVHSQQDATPDPDYAAALWVAQSERLSKLSTPDAATLLEIPAKNIRALAIDPGRGVIRAYGRKTLQAYAFNGAPPAEHRPARG